MKNESKKEIMQTKNKQQLTLIQLNKVKGGLVGIIDDIAG